MKEGLRGRGHVGGPVDFQNPADLALLKGGGAVVCGAVFEGVEPAFDFGEAGDDDDGEAVEAGERDAEDGCGRRAEDDIGGSAFFFAVSHGGVAVAVRQDLLEGGGERLIQLKQECLSRGS